MIENYEVEAGSEDVLGLQSLEFDSQLGYHSPAFSCSSCGSASCSFWMC
jgi:hypothetical protein